DGERGRSSGGVVTILNRYGPELMIVAGIIIHEVALTAAFQDDTPPDAEIHDRTLQEKEMLLHILSKE
ncbi:MAG: hypothetical protein QGI09_09855, partial [Dehalococcoidia bacterium]|nr:hypothetical protein [Dehalococcoidia bacterium]